MAALTSVLLLLISLLSAVPSALAAESAAPAVAVREAPVVVFNRTIAVYRALDFLMEQGFVHRLASRNAFLGCGHPDTNHQAQFLICDSCGSVAELADSRIVDAIADRAGRSGFAVAGHVVEIQGTCPDCRKAAHA